MVSICMTIVQMSVFYILSNTGYKEVPRFVIKKISYSQIDIINIINICRYHYYISTVQLLRD